jgi:hypothetical protein
MERVSPQGSIGLVLTFTDRARLALSRSDAAAKRFNPAARLRLAASPGGIEAALTEAPLQGDHVLELGDGLEVIVAAGMSGVVDVGEHDAFTIAVT